MYDHLLIELKGSRNCPSIMASYPIIRPSFDGIEMFNHFVQVL